MHLIFYVCALAWNTCALKIQEAPDSVDEVVDEIAEEISQRSLLQEGEQENAWHKHFEEQMQNVESSGRRRRRRDDTTTTKTPTVLATVFAIYLTVTGELTDGTIETYTCDATHSAAGTSCGTDDPDPSSKITVQAEVEFSGNVDVNSISTCGKTTGDNNACGVPFVLLRNNNADAAATTSTTGHATLPYYFYKVDGTTGFADFTKVIFSRTFRTGYFLAQDKIDIQGNAIFHNSGAIQNGNSTAGENVNSNLEHAKDLSIKVFTFAR